MIIKIKQKLKIADVITFIMILKWSWTRDDSCDWSSKTTAWLPKKINVTEARKEEVEWTK